MSSSSSSRVNSSRSGSYHGGSEGSESLSGGSGRGGGSEGSPGGRSGGSGSEGVLLRKSSNSLPLVLPSFSGRRPLPGERALHSSIMSNSIKFRHDEPEWYEDSSSSFSFSGDSGAGGMEVMDLRPSAHHAIRHMETSSLVSLGSKSTNSSIESRQSLQKGNLGQRKGSSSELNELTFTKMPQRLFNVRGGASSGSSKNSKGSGRGWSPAKAQEGGPAPPRRPSNDSMPTHWEEAEGSVAGSVGGGSRPERFQRRRSSLSHRISNNGRFLLGESEQAYRALMSLMGAGDNDHSSVVPAGGSISGSDGSKSRGSGHSSSVSVASQSQKSGFWSELGDALGSSVDSGSGSEEEDSNLTETSPLTRRRLRRRAFVRRCARAMAGVLALAALSASAAYFLRAGLRSALSPEEGGEGTTGRDARSLFRAEGQAVEMVDAGNEDAEESEEGPAAAPRANPPKGVPLVDKDELSLLEPRSKPPPSKILETEELYFDEHTSVGQETNYQPLLTSKGQLRGSPQDGRRIILDQGQGHQDGAHQDEFAPQGWN